MRIVVIGNGGPNKGAAALASSTLWLLSHISPRAHVALITEYPRQDRDQFGVDSCSGFVCRQNGFADKAHEAIAVSFLVLFMLAKLMGLEPPFSLLSKKEQAIRVCAEADLVVFPAGDTISDTYGVYTAIGSLVNILCAIALRKSVAILSAQVGPFEENLKGKCVSLAFKLLLNKVDLITVRDESSLEKLKGMGVNRPRIHLVADVAFLLRPASPIRVQEILKSENIHLSRPLVGINTSALIWRYGFQSIKTSREKTRTYVQLITHVVDMIAEGLGANVILLPHVFETDNDDRDIAQAVYHATRNKSKCAFIKGEHSPDELKGIIGIFDLFIATRMHPLIHAVSMAVPTLAIDYNMKQRYLMERIGQIDKVASIASLDGPDIPRFFVSMILDTFERRKEISEELTKRGKELTIQALMNGSELQKLIEKKAYANNVKGKCSS